MEGFNTRFAPSPTGFLHLGHVYSAQIAKAFAEQTNGSYHVRIEDIDFTRCRLQFSEQIIDDLAFLGLNSTFEVVHQSQRQALYDAAIEKLKKLGVLYPCVFTRKEIAQAQQASDIRYRCLDFTRYPLSPKLEIKPTESPVSWRLNAAKVAELFPTLSYEEWGVGHIQFQTASIGDVVISRKELGTSYHLSVVVDDATQKINCVTRGIDLLNSTPIHVTLQALLGLPTPLYHHHDLLKGQDGSKLAKKKRSESIKELREQRLSAEEILQGLAEY